MKSFQKKVKWKLFPSSCIHEKVRKTEKEKTFASQKKVTNENLHEAQKVLV